MIFPVLTFFASFFFLVSSLPAVERTETFVLLNGTTSELIQQLGPHINERVSPCSTFKIALCLMGFDAGILYDEATPVWEFKEGYDDFLASWKNPQTPQSWLTESCLWYSKELAEELGPHKFQQYLIDLNYGNQDMSGGLTKAWLCSSLQISPLEQVMFIQRLYQERLSISKDAIEKTKSLLFKEQLDNSWKLYGKTGWSGPKNPFQWGWFVGWIEKDNHFFPLAYQIREKSIDLNERIPRVKELLQESKVFEFSSI